MDSNKSSSVFHSLSPKGSFMSGPVLVLFLAVIVLGVVVGYYLSSLGGQNSLLQQNSSGTQVTSVQKGAVYGSDDTSTFKDTAEGVVQKGGVNGEGQFHLVRPGGDSQNVYMTSSLVDLSLFINRKVKVWGQTQKAQTAGWLMDVGRVEVEN